MNNSRLIVGISGASGIIYGVRLLEILQSLELETHLVVSKAAQLARAHETTLTLKDLSALATEYHAIEDVGAPIASGSFKTMGMVIAPCSMNTVGEIAHGLSRNLLTRSADVTLKEQRRLVILPRETPLHLQHLKNMVSITQMGGIIFPPVPAFYNQPKTLDDIINDTVSRVLDLFGIENPLLKRWPNTK